MGCAPDISEDIWSKSEGLNIWCSSLTDYIRFCMHFNNNYHTRRHPLLQALLPELVYPWPWYTRYTVTTSWALLAMILIFLELQLSIHSCACVLHKWFHRVPVFGQKCAILQFYDKDWLPFCACIYIMYLSNIPKNLQWKLTGKNNTNASHFRWRRIARHLLLCGHYPHYQQDLKFRQASRCHVHQIRVCNHHSHGYVVMGMSWPIMMGWNWSGWVCMMRWPRSWSWWHIVLRLG